MRTWCRNVYRTVVTVIYALWVGLRYWFITYDPKRGTYTEQYEYPELPAQVSQRFRGFHRYDLTTCIACERCARECPAGCILIGKQRVAGRKGFPDHQLYDRLREVHVLRYLHGVLPGRLHLHGLHVRPELLQPRGVHRRFFAASARSGLGARDTQSDRRGELKGDRAARPRRARVVILLTLTSPTPTEIVAYLVLFATVGFVFVLASLILGWFSCAATPPQQKLETYECGEPAVGPGTVQFDLRFYVVALLFLIFEVEVAFFFPPATVFGTAIGDARAAKAAVPSMDVAFETWDRLAICRT